MKLAQSTGVPRRACLPARTDNPVVCPGVRRSAAANGQRLCRLIPADRARALEERLARFEAETGHQIAVLTIPSLKGDSLEDFSIRVAEAWKIGKQGFDNGAILLIARDDRKLRIEVGYGLEGVMPDAIASRISGK